MKNVNTPAASLTSPCVSVVFDEILRRSLLAKLTDIHICDYAMPLTNTYLISLVLSSSSLEKEVYPHAMAVPPTRWLFRNFNSPFMLTDVLKNWSSGGSSTSSSPDLSAGQWVRKDNRSVSKS